MEPVLVSLCSLGVPCRYHGLALRRGVVLYRRRRIAQLATKYHLVPICPEQLGGLPTPREPCDRDPGGKVYGRKTGTDYTDQFIKGALAAVRICQVLGIRKAYLQARSPSCDPRSGMAAFFLAAEGVEVRKL